MAQDRGLIEQQLTAIGEGSRWWEERELRDLPSVLHRDETILGIARGRLGRPAVLRRGWLVVVTNQRLLCIRSQRGRGWRQVEMAVGGIERTALRVGPLRMRLLVTGGGERIRMFLRKDEAYKLSRALTEIAPPPGEMQQGFRPTRMLRRVMDHMLDLPAVALDPSVPRGQALSSPRPPPPSDDRVHELEHQVDELRQQIGFLEQLLEEKQTPSGVGR